MSTREVLVLEAKLDQLIESFNEHRKGSVKHEQIEKIWGVLKLHSVIGAFTFTIISAYIIKLIAGWKYERLLHEVPRVLVLLGKLL